MRTFLVAITLAIIMAVILSCHDDPPMDCSDQGGLCISGSSGEYQGANLWTCDSEPKTDQCPPSLFPSLPRLCCILKRCQDGRGYCRGPCSAKSTLVEKDDSCPVGNATSTPCCATMDGS